MFDTPLNVLYMTLSVGIIIMVLFSAMALFYLILVLRDVSKITEKLKNTTDTLSEYVVSPVRFIYGLYEKLEPMIDALVEKASRKRK